MGEPVEVRAAREDDDLDALNAGNPSWPSAESVRSSFAADPPDIPSAMFVAERDGVAVGYAHTVAAGVRAGHRALALIFVPPAHRNTGVGTALWQSVLTLCTPDRVGGIMLSASVDDERSHRIAVEHGWVRRGVHWENVLDLADIEPVRTIARDIPRPPGIVIRGLPADPTEAQWREVFELHNTLSADSPDLAGGADALPYEVFRSFSAEPWQVLLAASGDQLVAMTAVHVLNESARSLSIAFTGVARDYRGLGLSTKLKATHAIALHNRGWKTLSTTNMDSNAPILAANRTLGFVRVHGIVDYSYDFPAGHSAH